MDRERLKRDIDLTYNLVDEILDLDEVISEQKQFLSETRQHLNREYSVQNDARNTRNGQYISMQSSNIITLMNNISSLIKTKADLKLKINDQVLKLRSLQVEDEDGQMKEVMKNLIAKLSNSDIDIPLPDENVDDGLIIADNNDVDRILTDRLNNKQDDSNKEEDKDKELVNNFDTIYNQLKMAGQDLTFDDEMNFVILIEDTIIPLVDMYEDDDPQYKYLKEYNDTIKDTIVEDMDNQVYVDKFDYQYPLVSIQ